MHPPKCFRALAQSPADDMHSGGQNVEDTNSRMFCSSHLDILQRDDERIHQTLPLGNPSFDHQEDE